MATNVAKAYAIIDGRQVNAIFNSTTETWVIETNAPAQSSWGQEGHTYKITLHAEDAAGNIAEVGPEQFSNLAIRVLEKTNPYLGVTWPTEDQVFGTNSITIQAYADDRGGSGLDRSTLVTKFNGIEVEPTSVTENLETNALNIVYEAVSAPDGLNKFEFSIQDHDGNSASMVRQFIISTVAPLMSVITPTEDLITNASRLQVTGTAQPGSDYVTIETVVVNVVDGETVTADLTEPDPDGVVHFSAYVDLEEGETSLEIRATDTAGGQTSIWRTVVFDAHAPVISNVVVDPYPTVDANGMIRITFKVVDY